MLLRGGDDGRETGREAMGVDGVAGAEYPGGARVTWSGRSSQEAATEAHCNSKQVM